jgi:protein-S-isoprenylcysteine O-methyltransferase Ste14
LFVEAIGKENTMLAEILRTGLTEDLASEIVNWLWWVLLIVWIVMRFSMKQAKQRENPWQYAQHGLMVILGFWLLFTQAEMRGWLNRHLLPRTPTVWGAGVMVTAVGIAFAIWARLSLGSNWSGLVTLKAGHELIRKGPYRLIRHPIYTGILLGMCGTALVHERVRGWLGIAIVFAAFYFKARREERFLRQEFGSNFDEHARQAGMFLPKLSR